MSLINEALKRTKDAQQQNPPPASGPALKPVDPATAKSASNAKTLLYIMVMCVVLGNALLFLAIKDKNAKKEAAPAPVAATPATTTPGVVAQPPAVSAVSAVSTPAPAPVKPEPLIAAGASPAPAAPETNSTAAPAVVAAQAEPPKPAPLKLQSIIYNPAKPSAMVSGKFVFVGDKVQGFRVTAIDQETVTLAGNGQTNVLSLP